jgi:cytochrome c peroxidase
MCAPRLPWKRLLTLCFLGLLIACCTSSIEAQSRSSDEEKLRAELLAALRSGSLSRPEDLKRFYQRPSSIPYRFQEGVDQAAARELGELLFFDPRLSSSRTISCATCHNPEKYWVDGLAQSSEGNSRRSMALYNLAWDSCYTWHCRAGSLMSQSVMAMTAPKGMAAAMLASAPLLASIPEYKQKFAKAFPKQKNPVTPESIAVSIEYYVSSIVSPEAPFDRWVQGDEKAISPEAKRGFLKFHTKAPCAECHNLWRFSDSRRYDIGLENISRDRPPLYKSVGLSNIAERPPYMHDGSLASLAEVLAFYQRGGDVDRSTKATQVTPFELTLEDESDIILFLKALSGETPKDRAPKLPAGKEESVRATAVPSHSAN